MNQANRRIIVGAILLGIICAGVVFFLQPAQSKFSDLHNKDGKIIHSSSDLAVKNRAKFAVHFWASWCAPCLPELKQLADWSKKNAPPNFYVVSVDERKEDLLRILERSDFLSANWLWDSKGEFAKVMGTYLYPETYLMDSEGKVLEKWVGPQEWLGEFGERFARGLNN